MKREDFQPLPEHSKHKLFVAWGVLFSVAILVWYTWPAPTDSRNTTHQIPWDDKLLSCNDIVSAEPTEAFTTCKALAEKGWLKARRKIAWAYTQAGEYQNFTEAYTWVSTIKENRAAELIRYVMLLVFGNNEEDKEFGEKGIQKLANLNYAPANAYLGVLYQLAENRLKQTSNPVWLLEKSYEQNPNLLSAYDMAVIFSNGFGVERNLDKATSYLMEQAERQYPSTTNNVAWFLATLQHNPFTSSKKAVELALKVTQHPEHGDNHIYVDTLAATYAADGQLGKAIDTQKRAIALLQMAENIIEQDQLMSEYNDRLSTYEAGNAASTNSIDRNINEYFTAMKRTIESSLIKTLNVNISPPDSREQVVSN